MFSSSRDDAKHLSDSRYERPLWLKRSLMHLFGTKTLSAINRQVKKHYRPRRRFLKEEKYRGTADTAASRPLKDERHRGTPDIAAVAQWNGFVPDAGAASSTALPYGGLGD
jgi:hypothetical protein